MTGSGDGGMSKRSQRRVERDLKQADRTQRASQLRLEAQLDGLKQKKDTSLALAAQVDDEEEAEQYAEDVLEAEDAIVDLRSQVRRLKSNQKRLTNTRTAVNTSQSVHAAASAMKSATTAINPDAMKQAADDLAETIGTLNAALTDVDKVMERADDKQKTQEIRQDQRREIKARLLAERRGGGSEGGAGGGGISRKDQLMTKIREQRELWLETSLPFAPTTELTTTEERARVLLGRNL